MCRTCLFCLGVWCKLGLQRYTGVPVHRNIFWHDTNIVYWTSYRDIYDTSTYASTNMGKHCLQLVLTFTFCFLVLMHCNFPNKLIIKIHAEQCLALYSRWWTQTRACFQQGLSAVDSTDFRCPRASHEVFCNVSGKNYRCRPNYY